MTPALASWLLLGHAIVVATLSLATLCTYAFDKRRAKRGGRRVSERALHRLAWAGGAPGGWVGRHWLRHKTRKRVFAVQLLFATTLHALVAAGLTWIWLAPPTS